MLRPYGTKHGTQCSTFYSAVFERSSSWADNFNLTANFAESWVQFVITGGSSVTQRGKLQVFSFLDDE
jgi:hypothetical protein